MAYTDDSDIDTIRLNGRLYVSHACWTCGDYGGAGSVGLANIRVLLDECKGHVVTVGMGTLCDITDGCPYGLGSEALAEIELKRPWLIEAIGDYGSRCVWVRKVLVERNGWLDAMRRYPSLSDDEVSQVEMEWLDEAWESWLKRDLIATLPERLRDLTDESEYMTDSDIREAYHDAMESTNTYPEPEYNGVHVDVGRIVSAFADNIAKRAGLPTVRSLPLAE